MDLRLLVAEASADERTAVDDLLGAPASGWVGGRHDELVDGRMARGGHAARDQRHRLLPALQAVQARIGWISHGALNYICERLTVPPADAFGVATFYGLLSVNPRPPRVLHVCEDVACKCVGSDDLFASLQERFGPEESERDGAAWLRSPCLGQCDRGPVAMLTEAGDPPLRQAGDADLRLLGRIGVADPPSLHDYRAAGGYEALRRAFVLGPAGVIREVKDSGLMGRGGAAFPTGVKWEAVAAQPARPHYLICNADESEPGTFKDRVLLEGDPFALIEAMTIAAYATGCEHGYLYLRGEYPVAHKRLHDALGLARHHGYLGANILEHGIAFDIEIRSGAGAYICGEETAIFNSIEGFRGEPRAKPPFPVEVGLFGKPTLVNNVETLYNVLPLVLQGGRAFAQIGTGKSTGTKLFCVSGNIAHPGVYEIVFGTTLGELLELAGGVPGDHTLRAVLLGGAAGAFVGPDSLDLPLTFEGARATGATLGSGVVIAYDETADIPDILVRIAAFFRDESCGQCTPCRVGAVRQEEAMARLSSGRVRGDVATELALLSELATCMRDSSICGLGQTAPNAIASAIETLNVFGEEARP